MGSTSTTPQLREDAAARSDEAHPRLVTLLELVRTIGEVTPDDREVVATVRALLRSGRVRLCGNFRKSDPEDFS